MNRALGPIIEPHNIQVTLERRSGMHEPGVKVFAEWPLSENAGAIALGEIPKGSGE